MYNTTVIRVIQKLLPLLVSGLFFFPLHVLATDTLEITRAWAPEAPPNSTMAGYMHIHNNGKEPVVLVAANSPLFGKVEIHSMTMSGDMMRMRKLDELEIPAGGQTALSPGGNHLMLMKPQRQFKPGDLIPLSIVTREGQEHSVELEVRSR